ncbi:hypothetical protein ACHAXA_004147 [Cyclostephanos tholiformis]|uniref:Uncharacterized protein n=1 Tax=Cyclostephanos tholiformis TaxID=382380 RepID=A0ABD3RMT2_9STRA
MKLITQRTMAAGARNRRGMTFLPIIYEVESRGRRCYSGGVNVDVANDNDDDDDDDDDCSGTDGAYARKTRSHIYLHCAVVVIFFTLSSNMRHININPRRPRLSSDANRLTAQLEGTNVLLTNVSTLPRRRHGKGRHRLDTPVGASDAPLFYHISPGSTGSRTLYHAACASGFPSVHHKSFCISRSRGIDGVRDDVVRGVRSHYEVLRLYDMAYECCKLHSRGGMKRSTVDSDDNGDLLFAVDDHDIDNDHGRRRDLCSTPLREWTDDIRMHLASVIRSGIVGLFDTPYPYLSNQVLALADEYRISRPIIALTERDPKDWATSRLRNHGVLLCRDEYSHEGMGSSEFDIIGCYERASSRDDAAETADDSHRGYNATGNSAVALHFWDVFWYRSHTSKEDPTLQKSMEYQMMHHQGMYLPMTQFSPDIFGVRSRRSDDEGMSKLTISDKDIAIGIKKHILGGKNYANGHGVSDERRKIWRDIYSEPLTCRGRVNWNVENDTMEEYYHIPKTCVDGLLSSTEKKDAKHIDSSEFIMIPLIPYR